MKEEISKKPTLTVFTKEKCTVLGDLFGIFFEDLNHAADGGLYAELIQNRSFEFDPIDRADYHSLTAFEKVERGNGKINISVEKNCPLNEKNTHYVVLEVLEPGEAVGIMNLGFNTGIPLKEGQNYKFSCFARKDDNFKGPIYISLESAEGVVYEKISIEIKSSKWEKYEVTLTSNTTDFSSRLVITTKSKGKFCLDMISLFPEATYKNRPNGLRRDIAELLADLKPKFMRFPGGCLVHDGSLDKDARDALYYWKNTIGDIEKRPARRSNWRYNQTLGLGYYEYFQFCEDIGAKPLPVLPGGYNPHRKEAVPIDELQPWIDDALDLIEFATGDLSTEWGKMRAELGHAKPFNLEYIAIGNEEVGAPFFERYPYFHKAIKEKYPNIKVINSAGPFAAGGEYERGWKSAREDNSDLIDEHYYMAPEWFLANHHRYDNFKKDEAKVFLGEYASWGNTYYNALIEASYMIGLERNAHAVGLACYAPLLCNVDYVNWKPDMIWFNNHEVYGTANYYVQKLFMNHQGDHLLKIKGEALGESIIEPYSPITGKISVAVDQIDACFSDIKLKNNDTNEEEIFKDIFADSNISSIDLTQTSWENYTLSLNLKRVKGQKGVFIHFGEKDADNRFRWEVGGWQNQDSLVARFVSKRSSCLTQSMFTIETEREYELKLVVKGRCIQTFIDGKLINDAEDKPVVIEPLYYSASKEDESGDIIVKVVNVQENSVLVNLVFEDISQEILEGSIFEMSGYRLQDENSFEAPKLIAPKQHNFKKQGKVLPYVFPKQSITVFRLKGK